jgi:hypothetical protein
MLAIIGLEGSGYSLNQNYEQVVMKRSEINKINYHYIIYNINIYYNAFRMGNIEANIPLLFCISPEGEYTKSLAVRTSSTE